MIIAAPAVWVAIEFVRSNLFFLSWPWNLLGHSQYQYLSVIQIADITGVYGISFMLVMVNQVVSYLPDVLSARGSARRKMQNIDSTGWILQGAVAAFFLILTLSYGWYRLNVPESNEHIRVALVQGNVLPHDNMSYDEKIKYLSVYEKLTREAALQKPDLIVWPSSSLPAQISSRLVRFTVMRLAKETDMYLLAGGAGHEKLSPRREGHLPFSNSEFLIGPSGRLEGQYNKMRLLPFNEYLPLKGTITWPKWITTLPESFLPGDEYTLFQVSNVKFGAPICWENMFPDLFRRFVREGARFMVSVTNEGFFGRVQAPYQQSLAMNAFRAVENRVAIARSAPNGVSAFISPNGNIVERVTGSGGEDLFISGILVRDIPVAAKQTFYTRYGDVFAYAILGIAILFILSLPWSRKIYRSSRKIVR
jgi:apolipoprotein N-acyltransferase